MRSKLASRLASHFHKTFTSALGFDLPRAILFAHTSSGHLAKEYLARETPLSSPGTGNQTADIPDPDDRVIGNRLGNPRLDEASEHDAGSHVFLARNLAHRLQHRRGQTHSESTHRVRT